MQEVTAPDLPARLGATGYLAGDDLATVLFLARHMQRPLLLHVDDIVAGHSLATYAELVEMIAGA